MCIAILCTVGVQLPKDEAYESFKSNRNGAGFAYVDENGKVVAKKGFFEFDKFWDAYDESFKVYGSTSPYLVHFRIATAGKLGEKNCHPFILKEGQCGLIHNGILWSGSMNDELSDTAKFASDTADFLVQGDKMTTEMLSSLSKIVGNSNKIVLLYADRTYKIINENGYSAHWNAAKTIWYSNRTYENWNSSYNGGRAPHGANRDWNSSRLPTGHAMNAGGYTTANASALIN
jgi:predicted glutamine amidotransferase